MIVEYHRPNSINEALTLLAREMPRSYALGGGTILNRGLEGDYAVVDLQALGLGDISVKGNMLQIGSMVTLQNLIDFKGLPEDFYKSIELEATYNLRQMATIGGLLVSANGRSPLATTILSVDASLISQSLGEKPRNIKLGDWFPLRGNIKNNYLITLVNLPLNIHFSYEYVSRTPADQPIVCAAVTQWNSGRTRLALGGWGSAPVLAMDGPDPDGIEIAAKNTYSIAQDEWASAEYRQEIASVLSLRCLKSLSQR